MSFDAKIRNQVTLHLQTLALAAYQTFFYAKHRHVHQFFYVGLKAHLQSSNDAGFSTNATGI